MGVVLCALALILGIAVFVWVIWRIRADFYEDAMAKSEETAELLERAQSEKSGLLVSRRKKDRADSLRRDGMRHGAGANVFFFRSLYNRFRFAHFGFLTKTMETYLVAAIAVSLLSHSILAVALILAALTFFRTLGNPLEQDTMTDFFRMIPESTWAKLFWSLMGGTANCLLDVIPAVLLGALLTGTNVLTALIWIPVIVSVDFYATCIGTFIGVSVPVSAGKMMKQVVQILFIYFGLLPDIILAVLGMNHDSLALSMAGATVLNIGLGFLFFGLCPIFLEPANIRRKRVVTEFHGEPRKARRQISTLAAALAMILFLVPLIQRGVFFVFDQIWPQGDLPAPAFWLGSFLSMYLVAMPVAALLMRLVPAHPPEQHSVRPARFVQVAIICIFLLYTFNIGGALILLLLQSLLGIETINPMMELVADDVWWLQSLIMVVAAPVFEELIYRKLLIDRIRIYGERFAVVISGLAFGLTHGNLSQFFYAAALGCAFAYVYLRSGRIRYTIGLHMLINFLGGVVAPGLLIFIDLEGLATKSNGEVLKMLTPLLIYVAVMVALSLTGLVLFCNNVRNIRFEPMELEMPRGMMLKTVFCNAGTILFLAGTIYLFAQTFLP